MTRLLKFSTLYSNVMFPRRGGPSIDSLPLLEMLMILPSSVEGGKGRERAQSGDFYCFTLEGEADFMILC